MNFDICLIKTEVDQYGLHLDLSPNFDTIPCLPDKINLKEVLKSRVNSEKVAYSRIYQKTTFYD